MTMQPADNNAVPAAGSSQPGGQPGSQPEPIDYKALYEQTQQELANLRKEDWYKRAVGWQQQFQAEQQRAQGLETQIEDFKTKAETAAAALATKESDLAKLLEEKARFETDYGTIKNQFDRINLIATEFPHLLGFITPEADLLPTGAGDDLRAKLQAFDNRVKGMAAPAAPKKPTPDGATPPPPPPAPTDSKAALMKQAQEALAKGDLALYDELYTKAISAKE